MCRDFVIFSKIGFLDEQKTKRRPIFRKRSPEIQVLSLLKETYFRALFIMIAFLSSVTLSLVLRQAPLRTLKGDPLKYPRVYKVHGTPNFFPNIKVWTRISSLMIILVFASRPLNKGKNYIFIAFLSSLSPILLNSIKKPAQTRLKKAKNR